MEYKFTHIVFVLTLILWVCGFFSKRLKRFMTPKWNGIEGIYLPGLRFMLMLIVVGNSLSVTVESTLNFLSFSPFYFLMLATGIAGLSVWAAYYRYGRWQQMVWYSAVLLIFGAVFMYIFNHSLVPITKNFGPESFRDIFFFALWPPLLGVLILTVVWGSAPQLQNSLAPDTGYKTPKGGTRARYSFNDLVGMDDLKARLLKAGHEIAASRRKSGWLTKGRSGEARNGILLSGDPGNGKTLLRSVWRAN